MPKKIVLFKLLKRCKPTQELNYKSISSAITIFILLFFITSQSQILSDMVNTLPKDNATHPYYSTNIRPPLDLDSSKIPFFVHLGFDDNRYPDGLEWASETLLKGRVNPQGSGNKGTFDGTPIKASFYVIGDADYELPDILDDFADIDIVPTLWDTIPSDREVSDWWRKLYDNSNEVGGHTWTHKGQPHMWEPTRLEKEFRYTSKYLINVLGIPQSELYGFRTPYLDHSYEITEKVGEFGFLYDCSLGNGCQSDYSYTGLFPFTLENGHKDASSYKFNTLWELHYSQLTKDIGLKAMDNAFDSGFWPKGSSAADFLKALKSTFDEMYDSYKNTMNEAPWVPGFRQPLSIGLHSDYYSAFNTIPGCTETDVNKRRQVLIDFLDYVLQKPDARVVTGIDIIRWMKNPVTLDDLSRNDELTFKTDNGSGSIAGWTESTNNINGVASISNNSVLSVSYELSPNSDKTKLSQAGVTCPLTTSLNGASSLRITYSSDAPLIIKLNQTDLGDASYILGLPSTNGENKTIEKPISTTYFMQPRPLVLADAKSLDLSKVTSVSIYATGLDIEKTGTFSVSSFEFFGAGQITSDVAISNPKSAGLAKTIAIQNIKNNSLRISNTIVQKYAIDIYTLNGQKVLSLNKTLSKGLNKIPLKNIGAGCHIVKISNKNKSIKRALIFR